MVGGDREAYVRIGGKHLDEEYARTATQCVYACADGWCTCMNE